MGSDSYPNDGQSCAVISAGVTRSPACIKTAALLFDRVWVPSRRVIDHEGLGGGVFRDFWKSFWNDPVPRDVAFFSEPEWERYVDFLLPNMESGYELDAALPLNFRYLTAEYSKRGMSVVVVCPDEKAFDAGFSSSQQIAYQAAMDQLPVVDESQLNWAQILEFRSDALALSKYRNLRLWLTTGLKAESLAEARDRIAQKVEDYEWALHKHGLKTITGSLSEIFDHRTALSSAAAAIATGTIAGRPVLSVFAAGAVVVGRTAVWIAERVIERSSIVRGDPSRDAALILDAKRFLT